MPSHWNNPDWVLHARQTERARPLRHVHVSTEDPTRDLAVYAGRVHFEFGNDPDATIVVGLDIDEADEVGRILVNEVSFLTCGSSAVAAGDLRGIPFRALVLETMDLLGEIVDENHRHVGGSVTVDERKMEAATQPQRRGRPPMVSDDDLRLVAEIYNAAPPGGTGKAVAERLSVSASTARKRIHEARRRGFLPSTGGTTRPGRG
jgi:hypothetical protein